MHFKKPHLFHYFSPLWNKVRDFNSTACKKEKHFWRSSLLLWLFWLLSDVLNAWLALRYYIVTDCCLKHFLEKLFQKPCSVKALVCIFNCPFKNLFQHSLWWFPLPCLWPDKMCPDNFSPPSCECEQPGRVQYATLVRKISSGIVMPTSRVQSARGWRRGKETLLYCPSTMACQGLLYSLCPAWPGTLCLFHCLILIICLSSGWMQTTTLTSI